MHRSPRRRRLIATSLLAAWVLAVAGCRPLAAPPPGCTEGDTADTCTPQAPPGAARVTIIEPQLPSDPAQAPLSGRYLEVTVKVENAQAAREVELLCGSRRLATWSIPPDQESARTAALLDLLPCWDPIQGTAANPLPVQLTVAVLDLLGARHGVESVHLRVDFSQEEGLLGLDAGTVDLAAAPTLVLTLPSRLGVGVEGLLSLTSNMALAELPVIEIDGRQVSVRATGTQSWAASVPAGLPLGIEGPEGDVDQGLREIPVTVLARGFGGQHTRLATEFELHRELRRIKLPASSYIYLRPYDTVRAPVLTSEGLALLLQSYRGENEPTHLGRIQADGRYHEVALANSPAGLGNYAALGFNARGQLLVESADGLEVRLQNLPLGGGPTLLPQLLSAPVAFQGPLPRTWTAAGAEFFCGQEPPPGPECLPHVAARVCVDGEGAVTRTPPLGAGLLASSSAEVTGGPEVFISYGHGSDCSASLPPVLGIGAPGGEYRWLEAAALPLDPDLVLPAGTGAVVVQTDSNARPEAAARVERDGTVITYPLDQARGSLRGTLAAHPDGSLLILAEGSDGRSQVWRFRPGSDTPAQVASLMGTYAPPVNMAPESVLLPDGGLALLLYEARGPAVLVLDAQLQLRWRWWTAGEDMDFLTPYLRLSPDGRQLWLINHFDSQVSILGL